MIPDKEYDKALSDVLAENAELRQRAERAEADLEICMEAFERLKQPTVGPAILSHICEAGRNEIALRVEIAEKAQTSTDQWRKADAALSPVQATDKETP